MYNIQAEMTVLSSDTLTGDLLLRLIINYLGCASFCLDIMSDHRSETSQVTECFKKIETDLHRIGVTVNPSVIIRVITALPT